MTAGFPGTGIGGIFYILVALAMPLRDLWLRIRRGGANRGTSGRLFLLALGVVLGIFATGWLLGLVMSPVQSAASSGITGALSQPKIQNVLRLAALYASLLMLSVILLTVQAARLIVRKK